MLKSIKKMPFPWHWNPCCLDHLWVCFYCKAPGKMDHLRDCIVGRKTPKLGGVSAIRKKLNNSIDGNDQMEMCVSIEDSGT